MKKILLLLVLVQLSPVALARMYQWVDPDTGTTQLSGKPPTWYRSDEPGPRTIVYENGRVIDDTGLKLPAAESERLRQEALISIEQDRQAALEKLEQARQQKAVLEFRQQEEQTREISGPVTVGPEPSAAAEPAGPTAEQLRALIDQYEQMKTQDARELVETASPTTQQQ